MLKIDVPTVDGFRVLLRREYVYLDRVLHPFDANAVQIRKSDAGDGYEQLIIIFDDGFVLRFPEFEAGKYYKGMIPEYAYPADILALYDDEYYPSEDELNDEIALDEGYDEYGEDDADNDDSATVLADLLNLLAKHFEPEPKEKEPCSKGDENAEYAAILKALEHAFQG